jgi:DNA invertase Pin-like site-specific DNA recombinase
MAETEARWARFLEAQEGSPEAFFGQVLTMFAVWVADQELASIKRRTRDGLERARRQGKVLGRPPTLRPQQVEAMRRMRQGALVTG